MSMTPQLFGINALAVELDKDRRTIGRALRNVKPDGRSADGRHPAWRIQTCLRALEATEGRRRNDGGVDNIVIAELEFTGEKMCALLARLREEADIEKRRAMVKVEGHVVGAYWNALEKVREYQSPEQRAVEKPYLDKLMGQAICETLTLCQWELEPPSAEESRAK